MNREALAAIEYGDEAAVFVVADAGPALERARRAAGLARCRVAEAGPLAGAAGRLDRHAAAHPVVVDLGAAGADDPPLALLDRLREEAERGRAAVVVAPPPLTDLVAARAWHPRIAHLCAPSEAELVAAIALAAWRAPARLNDVGRDGQVLLQQLSEEVGRIASILASLSEEEAAALARPKALADAESGEPPVDAAYVRSLIRARRLREQFFRSDLFADPAWDMLLDLLAARLERNRVAVSSLCIAAAVPATTALRWIKALTDRGLFVRSADPEDGRRVYIELSDDAARALSAYLRAVKRLAPAVI
jgi:hypothetical protein